MPPSHMSEFEGVITGSEWDASGRVIALRLSTTDEREFDLALERVRVGAECAQAGRRVRIRGEIRAGKLVVREITPVPPPELPCW